MPRDDQLDAPGLSGDNAHRSEVGRDWREVIRSPLAPVLREPNPAPASWQVRGCTFMPVTSHNHQSLLTLSGVAYRGTVAVKQALPEFATIANDAIDQVALRFDD